MIRLPFMTVLFILCIAGCLLSFLLCGVFALVTVRKLSRNPHTQSRLGMYVYPWGQAFSVAAAMTLPRAHIRRRRSGAVGDLFADCDAIYAHTNRLDRCLGRAIYLLIMFSAAALGVVFIDRYLF
ncbi:hypothetical protein [Thiomonas sp.]|uniref:hypothetical protein n=1 Tax=Thiomonas sp. TaxID=2047785 RepID=UPI0026303CE1|nr:hypothetical protein [Thiomonas sp.]